MPEVSESIISTISQLLGTDAGMYEVTFVENMLQKRMAEIKSLTIKAYLEVLFEDKNEKQALESLLQNSYSEFFRNPLTFSALEKIVIPSLIADKRSKGKELRIWSAACASGQESYSLAMLLEEIGSNRNEPVRYRIFATDKSKSQIEQARAGCYSSFSMGNLSLKRLSKWFDKGVAGAGEDRYSIKNELKRNIHFSVFDLLEEPAHVPPSSIFGSFDVVFCANLLFYYKPVYREKIITKIYKSMSDNGLIVVGEAERDLLMVLGFTELFYNSGIFRR